MKMNRRISAAFVTMLFLLGIIAVPVSAHFTMGKHIPAYPFRTNHFDKHVQGLIGYVFPGSGLWSTYAPGWYWGAGSNTYPGYQSPWPYVSQSPPYGVNNPFPAQGPLGWYQLDANNYAPFGAMLTSTVKAGAAFTTMWKANRWASDNPTIESLEIEHAVKGDLILAFNITATQKAVWKSGHPNLHAVNFTFVEIMIPPEFTGLDRKNVVASFTNNYDNIAFSTRNREDFSYGPYYRRLRVFTDTAVPTMDAQGWFQADWDKMDDAPDSWLKQTNKPYGPFQFTPWKMFGNITFCLDDLDPNTDGYQGTDEWYYIRINDVTAPTIAGAYEFKFRRLWGPETASIYFPYQNRPVVLVKGEVDPAIITGTIRYGGWNTTLYGQPIELPGRVRAVGIADDPYTGKTTGRPVEARGYYDAAWKGHYEVEGVAPGVYDIYASAAGYPEIKIASDVKILKGQSYHIDGYLIPGVQIKGTVFSKCGTGETPWPYPPWTMDQLLERDSKGVLTGFLTQDIYAARTLLPQRAFGNNIKIEIYRSLEDAQSMMPGGSTSKAVTWSPYDQGNMFWLDWSFPWTVGGFSERGTRRIPGGVGPAPSSLNEGGWMVSGGKVGYAFQFGREGYYGAPCDMDGHVPGLDLNAPSDPPGTLGTRGRAAATWVSGIGPGTYWVRAWLNGYVQTEIDGVTFMPVTFTVPSIEWPGNVYIPFDLRVSSLVKKEVHFHDVPGTLMESPIGWGWTPINRWTVPENDYGYWRYLAAELVASGTTNYRNPAGEFVYAWALAKIPVYAKAAPIFITGFAETGLWYGYGRNYGIPSGLYTAKAYMWGYVEQVFEKVDLGLCGTVTLISDHLYRGARFNLTIYSKDWQHPTADKTWRFPYESIYVQIMKDGKFWGPHWDQYVMPITMQGYGNTTAAMWPYMWNNPHHMLTTRDAVAQVFGPNNDFYRACGTNGKPYWTHFFGPSALHYEASGYHFRYYDGSESLIYYYFDPGYGEGSTAGAYPYSFESGTYDFLALTYGYVQKKPVTFYATKGNATSDILIKLTQGAELQLNLKFKHEGVFEGLPFDAHLRVRVIDDKNKLVGEYLTSDWRWQPQFEWTTNKTVWSWNLLSTTPSRPNTDFDPAARVARSYWRLNYVPAGTWTVKVLIAGLPDLYGYVGFSTCDPCAATGDFGWEDRTIDAPYGIDASPNYKGGWKIQVHVVPVSPQLPPHYLGGPYLGWSSFLGTLSYAPGILTGELYYTADMKPVYTNHLGPYELRYDVVVPGTHLGGESSLVFELDRRGLITGTVYGYTYCDDWRTTAWTMVLFTAADGTVFTHYTFDGWFGAWLNAGPYTASVVFWTPTKGEGYKVQTMPYHVSDGAFGRFNIYLEQSGVPIPEFPVSTIVLASALAASLFILRRRRRK